jgi:hypothetical protein
LGRHRNLRKRQSRRVREQRLTGKPRARSNTFRCSPKGSNLTDEQKTTLNPILEDQAQQMKAIHADTSLSEEQKRGKMKAIHETFHDKINAVLTPEQQVRFKQMKHEHKGMTEGKPDQE